MESSAPSLVIHDIVGGNTQHLDALCTIFEELFPQYAHRSLRMRQKAARPANYNPLFIEHQLLLEIEGQPAGIVCFKYAVKRNLGFGVYLAVRPTFRDYPLSSVLPDYQRIAHYLIGVSNIMLAEDSAGLNPPAPQPPPGYVVEVEEPRLVERYRAYGFIKLPVDYFEPRLDRAQAIPSQPDELGQGEFRPAHLGFFPARGNPIDAHNPVFLRQAIMMCLVDHYQLPENHWAVLKALESIPVSD